MNAGQRQHEPDHPVASGWEKCFKGFVGLLIDWTHTSVVTATIQYLMAVPYWDQHIPLVKPEGDSWSFTPLIHTPPQERS